MFFEESIIKCHAAIHEQNQIPGRKKKKKKKYHTSSSISFLQQKAGIFTNCLFQENHYHDILTPPDQCEAPQVLRVRQEGHEDETVQVQALHQDPVVVCSQEIDEQQDRHFTTHLKMKSEAKKVNTHITTWQF